ncbi:hypothetical protein I546_5713 [Mycobacterium kansasii 732]|nr:hypothetical protein I546_5713 [Mycobacterium kansasii 732]
MGRVVMLTLCPCFECALVKVAGRNHGATSHLRHGGAALLPVGIRYRVAAFGSHGHHGAGRAGPCLRMPRGDRSGWCPRHHES